MPTTVNGIGGTTAAGKTNSGRPCGNWRTRSPNLPTILLIGCGWDWRARRNAPTRRAGLSNHTARKPIMPIPILVSLTACERWGFRRKRSAIEVIHGFRIPRRPRPFREQPARRLLTPCR